jgi:hypothetical protein
MVESFRLNRLGFGCVGLVSAQTLVGPRRLGGASYHSIRVLFLDLIGNLKLGHYPMTLCVASIRVDNTVVTDMFLGEQTGT